MKFCIGFICKKLCSKFEFLEYLHRKVLLRGVNEFIANCPHFMSDCGEILAADLHGMLFGICVSSKCAQGTPYVCYGRQCRYRETSHIRTVCQSVRHIADGAAGSCRLPQMKLTTHLHEVPKLSVSGGTPPSHMPSLHEKRQHNMTATSVSEEPACQHL
jgi:hypothetical protein